MNLPDLQAKIHQLELEKSQLALPSLPQLESDIQFAAARVHSIDPKTAAQWRDKLQDALNAKQLAEENWSRNGQINTELSQLRQQLHFAEHDERHAIADKASKDLAQAASDYESAAKATIRAYRRCMQLSARNAGIPGASTGLPNGPHLPLRGFGYGGGYSTYQEMAMGLLPFEKEEQVK
jgi:hypothetical protein